MDVLEVSEDGTLTIPEVALRGAKPHTRFLVERQGKGLLLRPEVAPDNDDAWLAEWDALTDSVTAAWTGDKDAVETMSEMRR